MEGSDYNTTFFQTVGLQNPFLISMITTIVNVCSTPISFYTIEKFGRRPLLIWGAVGMTICEFVIAIVGTVSEDSRAASYVLIVFVCLFIFFFASYVHTPGKPTPIPLLTAIPTVPGVPQAGSSSERSSNSPSAPKALPFPPPPIGSGTVLSVSVLFTRRPSFANSTCRSHRALHGRPCIRQPRLQGVLHLGRPLRLQCLLGLLLRA